MAKLRLSSDGLHFFDRKTGTNVLFDEICIPPEKRCKAPRFVSIALTNRCNLKCSFCYAPKSRDELDVDRVKEWLMELDSNGCLGVGFGGGEPTLYPQFAELCQYAARNTKLAITFTTHGHEFSKKLADELRGVVNFVRLSMDGVEETYTEIRGRPFNKFVEKLELIKTIAPVGINFVVNASTIVDLDAALDFAERNQIQELLLLPEYETASRSPTLVALLEEWVRKARPGKTRLAVSEFGMTSGMPLAFAHANETDTEAYVHINAFGEVAISSFAVDTIPIANRQIQMAIDELRCWEGTRK